MAQSLTLPGPPGREIFIEYERTEAIVSASREKKTRQDGVAQGPTSREQKRQQEERDARRSKLLYRVVGAVCVVLAVTVIVWNSGMIQRSAAAVTVNGEKYTAADVQYYLRSVLAQNGISASSASSMQSMVVNQETGETMYDYMVNQAVDSLVTTAALADKAGAEGFTMTEETKADLDKQLADLENQAITSGFKDRDEYLRAVYGSYMSYDRFVKLYTRNLLVSDYTRAYVDGLDYGQADLEGYYQENKDALDSYTLSRFTFQAQVETTDEQGNDIEMTDEEKADALAQAQSEKKAVAEELQAKLEAGEDPAALAEEYAEALSGSSVSQSVVGSALGSSYGDWAKEAGRKAGDVTLIETEGSDTSSYLYVVRFEGRARDDSDTANVRHILVSAEKSEGAEAPTQEQLDEAKQQAQSLLDEWKAGDATETSFALLAQEHTDDTGSASSGGLISGITADSAYVESFKAWAMDPARKEGDTGLVESEYGWHIMYYVDDVKVWERTAENALYNADYSAWEEKAMEGYEGVRGFGMKFVTV